MALGKLTGLWKEASLVPNSLLTFNFQTHQGLANLFYKGPEGKYFRLCGTYSVSQLFTTAVGSAKAAKEICKRVSVTVFQ